MCLACSVTHRQRLWLPVMLRRFPRRNRSATGYVSPCLPAFQRLLFFFPLAGWSVGLSDVSGTYWATGDEDKWHNRFVLQASAGSCVVGWVQPDQFVSLRCVRAREEQAIPLFWIVWFWSSLNVLRDWPESEASSWVSWSVSGLFSNPPAAVWLPVICRRQPRWNRSATGCVSPLPAGISVVTFIFPVVRVGWRSVGC